MRLQIYIENPEVEAVLLKEAEEKGILPHNLGRDIIYSHYGFAKVGFDKQEAEKKILDEIAEFIGNNPNTEFDLHLASKTFRDIPMLQAGGAKPSAYRAYIGRVFLSKIGKAPFEKVEKVLTKKGNQKLSKNRAALYIVRK